MSFDYALEGKLIAEGGTLHEIFANNVMCCQNILMKYKSVFPLYTDHTSLHSLEVIAFCNELVGENIDKLNCDEIFILLMAAYLHDSGMGISESDYKAFSAEMPVVAEYMDKHPDAKIDEIIRTFHHDFGGKFIEKYQMLFDFPSEAHLWATVQVSRGHRKTDLYDETEFPSELLLENGNVVHLPYLAALIRITDELDISIDRNIQFMYDITAIESPAARLEFEKHTAIKEVMCLEDSIQATVDFSTEEIRKDLFEEFGKLIATLDECVDVIEKRTPFTISQKTFKIIDYLTHEEVK